MDTHALFSAIDHQDPEGFARFLAEDGTFRMGAQPPVRGRAAVAEFVRGFWTTIETSRHSNVRDIAAGDELFLEGTVTYGLKNGQEVAVPFLNHLRLKDGLATEYAIYLDPTPVMTAMSQEQKIAQVV